MCISFISFFFTLLRLLLRKAKEKEYFSLARRRKRRTSPSQGECGRSTSPPQGRVLDHRAKEMHLLPE
jgi:hypothetical protein